MAKDTKNKSKKPAKAKEAAAVAPSETPKKASVPRGVKKHLRELESQLADAARKEQKRVQKLERAAQRRQSIGSALDKLRIRTAGPAVAAAPAPAAPAATAPKTPAARTPSPRPPSTRRPAAGATRAARKAPLAAGPAAPPSDSSEPDD